MVMTNWDVDILEVKSNFKNGNYNSIINHLAKVDRKATLNNKSVSVCWEMIKFGIDKVITLKTKLSLFASIQLQEAICLFSLKTTLHLWHLQSPFVAYFTYLLLVAKKNIL